MSWKDIENRYNTQGGYFENYVSFQDSQKISKYNQLLELYGIEGFRKTNKLDSFDWLIHVLQDPEFQKWRYPAFVHGLMNLDNKRFALPEAVFEWTEKLLANIPEEVGFIAEYIEKIKNETGSIKEVCLVARTNNLLKQYESAISAKGFEIYLVRRSEAEDRSSPGLRLATMHRVKGIEFDRVIIAGVNEAIVPFEGTGTDSYDPIIKRESEVHERALLYVSATRAKKEVVVTSFGKTSRFSECLISAIRGAD